MRTTAVTVQEQDATNFSMPRPGRSPQRTPAVGVSRRRRGAGLQQHSSAAGPAAASGGVEGGAPRCVCGVR